jgi:signal transduction histidine kinase
MKSEHRYRTLYDIAKKLTSSLAPNEVLSTIVESTTKAVKAKGCSLMLLTPDKKQLIHTVSYGLSKWYLRKGPVRSDAVIDEVLKGNPVAVLDATRDPRVQYKEQAREEGIVSMLSIPLMPDGEVMGIMRVYTAEPRQFSPETIEFLSSLANLGAIALGKARVHEALGEDLKQRSAEVARLEDEKEYFLRFLSIAAHDLKAPLTAIQGFLWVMLRGLAGELTDKQRNMLERSTHRINELLNLISDLLDIPRIESGQLVQEMKPVSLRKILKGCCAELRERAKQKRIKLKAELPQALPKIRGAAPRLQQVLTNLISNAIDYTTEGVVTVRVKERTSDVQVEVMDTGIGIPAEELPKVFDDFFRASNVEIKGTGLGLSITKRIVEAHGGSIFAESPCPDSNTGSKFTFTLPKKA